MLPIAFTQDFKHAAVHSPTDFDALHDPLHIVQCTIKAFAESITSSTAWLSSHLGSGEGGCKLLYSSLTFAAAFPCTYLKYVLQHDNSSFPDSEWPDSVKMSCASIKVCLLCRIDTTWRSTWCMHATCDPVEQPNGLTVQELCASINMSLSCRMNTTWGSTWCMRATCDPVEQPNEPLSSRS